MSVDGIGAVRSIRQNLPCCKAPQSLLQFGYTYLVMPIIKSEICDHDVMAGYYSVGSYNIGIIR